MRNILIKMKYDGSNYHGWQIQSNAVTVQETFQNALQSIIGELPEIKGCSRTDAGVHANMYCLNFHTEHKIPCMRLIYALNSRLPRDIAVFQAFDMPEDFHARYSSKGKVYEYLVWNSRVMDPFLNGRALQFTVPIDEKTLDDTAKVFLGTHDFSAFCSTGTDVEDKVRNVSLADVKRDGDLVTFRFSADGFLYNMARIMTGSLLQTARGCLRALRAM